MTLDQIGLKHGTDKASNHHDYLRVYEKTFGHLRNSHILLLELGFGGFEDPDAGGESVYMWMEYFKNGHIACIDLHKKNVGGSLSFFQTSQDNKVAIELFIGKIGNPSIIIDDASHLSSKTIGSFEILFPLLTPGGFYCVEDTHSSYHSFFYSRNEAHENPRLNGNKTITALNYFKNLTDAVNNDLLEEKYRSAYDIESISFSKDLVIIKKK